MCTKIHSSTSLLIDKKLNFTLFPPLLCCRVNGLSVWLLQSGGSGVQVRSVQAVNSFQGPWYVYIWACAQAHAQTHTHTHIPLAETLLQEELWSVAFLPVGDKEEREGWGNRFSRFVLNWHSYWQLPGPNLEIKIQLMLTTQDKRALPHYTPSCLFSSFIQVIF